VFLFLFGTGPIRGFAVTLTIGLIANVFTAIYVSKTIFQYHLSKMDRQAELSICFVLGLLGNFHRSTLRFPCHQSGQRSRGPGNN
jgi:Protein export membrane protein